MASVKVLPKYQITIPKPIRKKLNLHLGDAVVLDEEKDKIILRKGKTIYDYVGALPNTGMSIEEIREKAIHEAVKDE
ncbi:AbrB family transcriptional regulator [Candidatus Desantisbacteria bacterium CG07_land_8_20_14_0_80_39_15]|uniref:AbrB family transcriptional regulator n=1 Tax=Candidatus Desantisbacteria bacterium CG07_land_8_20_14_0_80_39_15 TaxID=1974549 RepID=A0A2M6ZEL8_9BACT|nr:MAG: AbrB family transcriptional regulator [Candidatus Desantisbacteria bacterium CG07_land_8_20_14_0_80_39_15]